MASAVVTSVTKKIYKINTEQQTNKIRKLESHQTGHIVWKK